MQTISSLEALAALLASGNHAELETRVAQWLEPGRAELESLLEAARQGRAPAGSRERCLEIRRLIGEVRELVEHAEQVRAGLTGIVCLLYEGDTGSRYSSTGTTRLTALPRVLAEA
jgi:hypothetical protein